jgi:hypothetical protein
MPEAGQYVPWGIGGGAVQSARLGRLLAFHAINGLEGVTASTDLAVQSLVVAGTSIRVSPGSCGVIARHLSAYQEAYLDSLQTEVVKAINPTDGSGGRSDLVIYRVENPHISGEPWSMPEDVANGPYGFVRVIENVPNTTVAVTPVNAGWSAIPLARIDLPANTGTITQAMVKDLRKVIGTGGNAGGQTPGTTVPGGGDGDVLSTQTAYFPWPGTATQMVDVPAAATVFDLDCTIANVQVLDGDKDGYVRAVFNSFPLPEKGFTIAWPGATTNGTIVLHYNDIPVPAEFRGKKVPIRLEARSLTALGAGKLVAKTTTSITFKFEFQQAADLPAA